MSLWLTKIIKTLMTVYRHGLHGSAFKVSVGTKNYIINENEKDLNYFPQYYELNTIRSVRKNHFCE